MRLSRDIDKARSLIRNRRFLRAVGKESPHEFVAFFNRWNTGENRWPIKVDYDETDRIYRVTDTSDKSDVYISRASRVSLYANGIETRLKFLWDEYLASQVPIAQGDIVLDIGANVGEFSVEALNRGARTFSFEPDPAEFRSLAANIKSNGAGATPLNLALWNERKTMTFYSKNSTGDSSLIKMGEYSEKIDVSAVTLDEITDDLLKNETIQLIKLEAEGAEPEIIQGAKATLGRTRFVAADAGPERGMAQANTVVEVLNALQQLGFELIQFGNHRHIMLFEQKGLK